MADYSSWFHTIAQGGLGPKPVVDNDVLTRNVLRGAQIKEQETRNRLMDMQVKELEKMMGSKGENGGAIGSPTDIQSAIQALANPNMSGGGGQRQEIPSVQGSGQSPQMMPSQGGNNLQPLQIPNQQPINVQQGLYDSTQNRQQGIPMIGSNIPPLNMAGSPQAQPLSQRATPFNIGGPNALPNYPIRSNNDPLRDQNTGQQPIQQQNRYSPNQQVQQTVQQPQQQEIQQYREQNIPQPEPSRLPAIAKTLQSLGSQIENMATPEQAKKVVDYANSPKVAENLNYVGIVPNSVKYYPDKMKKGPLGFEIFDPTIECQMEVNGHNNQFFAKNIPGYEPKVGDRFKVELNNKMQLKGVPEQVKSLLSKEQLSNERELLNASLNHPDQRVRSDAKKILKEHESSLVRIASAKAKEQDGRNLSDVESMAEALKKGTISLSSIKNTRGVALSNKVMSEVRKEYPNFNFTFMEANRKYIESSTNQRILGAVDASLPRVQMLAEQAENLKNSNIPAINRVMKEILTQTGSSTYTDFESNRNAIVQEVNTALSGSSVSSDMRVSIELENLKSARSPKQLLGAIGNLREALLARRESSQQYIYPMEVVRGEMTISEFNENVKKKYRGKYGEEIKSNKTGNSKYSSMSNEELLKALGN